MSLTTLLVFISLYTETSGSLPSTAYLKLIDVWFVFSITYLTLIICVHLATFTIGPKSSQCSMTQTDPNTKPQAAFIHHSLDHQPTDVISRSEIIPSTGPPTANMRKSKTPFSGIPKTAFTNESPNRCISGPKIAFNAISPLDTHITELQSRLRNHCGHPCNYDGSCPICLPVKSTTWASANRAESLLKVSRAIMAATLILFVVVYTLWIFSSY